MDTQSLFSQILEEQESRELHGSRFERFFIIKDLLDSAEKKLQKARELFTQEMERMATPSKEQYTTDQKITDVVQDELEIISKEESIEPRKMFVFREREEIPSGQKIVEGIFDGQNMIGLDGKQYHVPVNYASKSKLTEGDTLKLTISGQGNFLYKQIGPIERMRIVATLDYNSDMREYTAKSQDKVWKVLTASITYFKGIPGDEIVLIVPKGRMSTWAAVENIIKKDIL